MCFKYYYHISKGPVSNNRIKQHMINQYTFAEIVFIDLSKSYWNYVFQVTNDP